MLVTVAKPSPSLLALKPRQLLLSSNSNMKNKASAQSLNAHKKSLLLRSVAHFLERNSFFKTLKKFLSEAQIQKDDLTSSSLDLEEMCCKYLAMSDHSRSNSNREQFQDMEANGNPDSDGQVGIAPALENATRKKKKIGNESSADIVAGQAEVDDKSANSKKSEEQVFNEELKAPTDDIGSQLDESVKKQKEKKKKKSKLTSESHVDKEEYLGGEPAKYKDAVPMESTRVSAWKEDETKDKKKKKDRLTSDSFVDSVEQHGSEDKPQAAITLNASDILLEEKTSKSKSEKKKRDVSEELESKLSRTKSKNNKDYNNGISKEDSTTTDNKDSKKRKRLESEAHDSQPVDESTVEDSKRRKTESSEAHFTKLNSLVGADKLVGNENNGEIGEVGEFEKKPSKQLHEQENGNIEKNGKNSEQRSLKKQQNGSVQSKKPFQRVNVDEVLFVDRRLEDNSYWAKDGAENGYGAKAQEVLGQVRGRGFRHEKTKKKRGSYRGGQIDLQSHSIKFNYSDEE